MSTLMEDFPKQSREAGLVQLMRRDGDHGVVESFLCAETRIGSQPLHCKKGQSRHDSNSLVSIQICLCFGKMKRIRGRHFENISVSVKERILGRSECRLDQARIPDSRASPVIFQSHRVQRVYLFQREKHGALLLGELL